MRGKILILFAAGAAAVWGQRITDRRTATIRGGGGDGKCTIEVVVDGVAQVEIRGNDAAIRTISGAPASFRRFECNQEMPNRPYNFRFQGVDGRGRQDLVNSPENSGQAVIRIEDSKGGSEGYTFDIFWNGGNYSGGRGGDFGNGRGGFGGGGFGRGRGDIPGNFGNVPAVSVDTGGRGSFNSRNMSGNVNRGFVNTQGQPNVGFQVNGRTVTFFGNIANAYSDREFQINITGSSLGSATGTAQVRLNGDRNEVEAINVQGNMNGRGFNGNFSR
jgi:hypothetical protein